MKKNPPSFFRAGFTLAEVMIAMGIVASVMVALLGMIPLGVRSVREATNMTLSGRIAQEVISNIQQSNWKSVTQDFDKKTFDFDNEGFLIRNKSSTDSKSVPSFQARVDMEPLPIEFGKVKYGLDTLRKVVITVEFTPDGRKIPRKPDDKNPDQNLTTYTFYVANQNKTG